MAPRGLNRGGARATPRDAAKRDLPGTCLQRETLEESVAAVPQLGRSTLGPDSAREARAGVLDDFGWCSLGVAS